MAVRQAQLDQKFANRVLDLLDRWSERCRGHHPQRREIARNAARVPVTIYLNADLAQLAHRTKTSQGLVVWLRNISPRGLCIISRQPIEAREFVISLPVENEEPILLRAKIVRSRVVHDGFHEYGARFRERMTRQ